MKGYSERAYGLWVERLAKAESDVERWERRLSIVIGRVLKARKRAASYRAKLAKAEEEAQDAIREEQDALTEHNQRISRAISEGGGDGYGY